MRIVILIFILIIFSGKSLFALKPDNVYPFRPESLSLIYKEFNVTTEDKYKIKVWFFPAQDTIPFHFISQNPIKRKYSLINDSPCPTVILCDGDAGNMSPLSQFAFYICSHGYNVVTFDWRGFGESDEWHTNKNNLCYTEYFKDYNAVIDSIKHLKEVDINKIGLYGFSTGAYLSFPISFNRSDIKCFIGRGLTTDLETIKNYWKNKDNRELVIPSDYPKSYYPKNIADRYIKPCLLIVGELDEITPAWMSQEIYEKLKGEKELWLVKDVGHGVEWDKSVGFKNYVNRMIMFYDKYLK